MSARDGNTALVAGLAALDVDLYAGVNGGGVIHIAKLLEPVAGHGTPGPDVPRLFTVPEYVAGYVPLGHYLATGRVAACLTTTGAATKLASSGISDAKCHNIPAVYVVALNSTTAHRLAPLQDVSDDGAGMVRQLEAELGDACLHVDGNKPLDELLDSAQRLLRASRPVVLAVHPDVLAQPAKPAGSAPDSPDPVTGDGDDEGSLARFLHEFAGRTAGRRVVMLVTEEAARHRRMPELTGRLAGILGSPVVWTVNGAAAVAPDEPLGHGHIGFGGNDVANALWRDLDGDDVVLALGFEPGEYVLDMERIPAGTVYHLTAWERPYGHLSGGFAHRCAHDYQVVPGELDHTVAALVATLEASGVATRRQAGVAGSLNHRQVPPPSRPGTVDFAAFLAQLHRSWRAPSLGFDDVCLSYKDRQFITQRPHPGIRFYSAYQGSAMGGAFGLAVGAKLADPSQHVFCFSGDGCYRLYAGALPECARLGLRLFILDNGSYAIVDQGLRRIIPDTPPPRYHGALRAVDYVAAARAHGWAGVRVAPDLSNLDAIVEACYRPDDQSLLVEVPIDPDQELGHNPRVARLTMPTYL